MDAPSRRLGRRPLRLPRLQIPFLPIFAGLSFAGLVVALGALIWLAFEWGRVAADPYWPLYESSRSVTGVRPLIDEGVPFDVGLSVFAIKPDPANATERRPGCSFRERAEWRQRQSGSAKADEPHSGPWVNDPKLRNRTPCDYHYVPETEELWGGIVARNLRLSDQGAETDIAFDIPAESLAGLVEAPKDPVERQGWHIWRAGAAPMIVYASVTLVPRVNALTNVEWYKGGMDDLPYISDKLLAQIEDSVKVSDTVENRTALRDTYLNSLSVRVPLVVRDRYTGDKSPLLATAVQATLLRQTHWIRGTPFEEKHALLMHGAVSSQTASGGLTTKCTSRAQKWVKHRLLCADEKYGTTGHWRAAYELQPDGSYYGNLRYAPYLSYSQVSSLSYTKIPKVEELQGTVPHTLKLGIAIVGHRRMALLDQTKEVWRTPTLEDMSRNQQDHDKHEMFHAILGLRQWGRTRIGGSYFLLGLSSVGWLAARLLTLLYWSTRGTTTGISVWGTALLIAGEALRSIAFTYDYYLETLPGWLFWLSIWGILLLPEVLQLRVILPTALEKHGDSWVVVDVQPTARERRSARHELSPRQLAALMVFFTAASYVVYGWPMRVLQASHDLQTREKYDYPYRSEKVFSRMSLLPLAQATVTTGQIAQLVMNYRSKTFAGNYALTCACKVAALTGMAAPFLAGKAYHEGLYLAAVAQGVLVLAEAAQACWCPRVEQEVEDDDVEL